MTKLKAYIDKHNLDPAQIARMAIVAQKNLAAYIAGEKEPYPRDRTYITQAIRALTKEEVTVWDLFENIPPAEPDF
jgi:hypothetical protein